jgi:hypothetical protein
MNQRGEQGTRSVNAEASPTGSWACFIVMQDCTVTALVMPKEGNDVADYYGDYPQGFVFYGIINQVTVSSGVIMLFNFADPARLAAIKG